MLSSSLERARDRIRDRSDLNAFLSLTGDEGSGPVVAVKDLIDVRGCVTTAGSPIPPREPAADDAPLVRRLRAFGCVIVGKTNMNEWALGPTGENAHYGPALNPRDPTRMSGGSSSGSAVAVAAGMCDWAIGTDTGGSVRIPASLCGVVGFKPTLGTVSTEGVVPLSPSLDTVGTLAPNVSEAAKAFEVISGIKFPTPREPIPIERLRLATPIRWVEDVDDATGRVWSEVAGQLGLTEIPFPDLARATHIGQTLLRVEASAFHRHWLQTSPEKYGADTRARLEQGLQVPAADYLDALDDGKRFQGEAEDALLDWDALILPTTACVAPRWEEKDVNERLARFMRPFNVSGQPSVSLPAPTSGLPVGIQVVGHFQQDARLIRVALAVERALSAHR